MNHLQFPNFPNAPLTGAPEYLAFANGEIWSCLTNEETTTLSGYAPLKQDTIKGGYKTVKIYGKNKKVHRLILEAFRGPCPPDMEGCHNDGNPANNHLDNLRWGTKKENAQDKELHGTVVRGEKHPKAVLSEKDIEEIRYCYETKGETQNSLAKRFNTTQSSISRILNGKRRSPSI